MPCQVIGSYDHVITKTFIVYIAILNISSIKKVHPLKRAQIAYFKVNETFIKVTSRYANFVDIFSSKLAIKFHKYTSINNCTIKLVIDSQLLYGLINSLVSIKLEN